MLLLVRWQSVELGREFYGYDGTQKPAFAVAAALFEQTPAWVR